MIYEKEKRYIIPFDDVPTERAEMPEISVDDRRGNFTEVETGFPEDVALAEARRCLSCRRCLGCALCWAECKPEAIDFSIPHQDMELDFDEVIITRGQDNGFESVDSQLGYGNYADVITDLQFERMLSPTGPTDGLVVSPRDGEIPGKIALIQGSPGGDDDHLLSSVVLGVNEAILAINKVDDLEVVLVSPVCQAFKDQFASDVESISGLQIVEGMPESVERAEDESPLSVTYSQNGDSKKEDFDLVVVLTKSKISPEVTALGKKLEQEIL
jgi:heterodisulfide reductase subunit A-like polyferredoxin